MHNGRVLSVRASGDLMADNRMDAFCCYYTMLDHTVNKAEFYLKINSTIKEGFV